jgi:hypothetical protein
VRAVEAELGIVRNDTPIQMNASTSTGTRIPDFYDRIAGTIGEAKNVGYQLYTAQLRDYAQYAAREGLDFTLYVRKDTILSGPLQAAREQRHYQCGAIIP